MHQLNLEWLSTVVCLEQVAGKTLARPDTLLGTDSHTPMVGGLGVLGWGVGGIEAQAAMLGHRALLTTPARRRAAIVRRAAGGVTATDLVLHVAEFLRRSGVVNAFVEVFGEAVGALPIETRATIANMAPEYGATSVYFPIDRASLEVSEADRARGRSRRAGRGLRQGAGPVGRTRIARRRRHLQLGPRIRSLEGRAVACGPQAAGAANAAVEGAGVVQEGVPEYVADTGSTASNPATSSSPPSRAAPTRPIRA